MKKIYLIAFALILFAACQKSDLPGDNGCISKIKRQYFNLKPTDSIAAFALLQQNKLQYNDLYIEYFAADTLTNVDNTDIHQSIFAIQNFNGIPILSSELWYQFDNGVLQSQAGTRYNSVNVARSYSLSLPQLRELYMTATNKNNSYLSFKDSCLVAEFGYYDLNANTTNQAHNIVAAWSIKPAHSAYPQAIFQEGTGKTIIYNSGIVFYDAERLK